MSVFTSSHKTKLEVPSVLPPPPCLVWPTPWELTSASTIKEIRKTTNFPCVLNGINKNRTFHRYSVTIGILKCKVHYITDFHVPDTPNFYFTSIFIISYKPA